MTEMGWLRARSENERQRAQKWFATADVLQDEASMTLAGHVLLLANTPGQQLLRRGDHRHLCRAAVSIRRSVAITLWTVGAEARRALRRREQPRPACAWCGVQGQ